MTARWFVVMLPGEYAETSDMFGPFRSLEAAEKVRDDWNADPRHAEDQSRVMPVKPVDQMKGSAA